MNSALAPSMRGVFTTLAVLLFVCALTIETASAQTTPVLSLLWEANSYTHPFYRGRALPAANASVRVFADARFPSGNEGVTYTWTINGRVMQNLSGVGRNSLTLGGPVLFGALVVSVEATSAAGERATRAVRIEAQEPLLTLYENHSLIGMRYFSALTNGSVVHGSTIGFLAVPFFVSPPSDPRDISYSWEVNDTDQRADVGTPYALTLERGKAANAKISLSIKHARQQFQSASRSWQLFLSEESAASPFNSGQ